MRCLLIQILLVLPFTVLGESLSKLVFDAVNTIPKIDDIKAQLELRSNRVWGRIYIDGWPQTIQYYRAHFGDPPPYGRKKFIFANPLDACEDISFSTPISNEYIILAFRGNCTFGTKANIVLKSSAAGLVIINNEEGIEHLHAPDAHDVNISVTSIMQVEGKLLHSVYTNNYLSSEQPMEGYIVPINCHSTGFVCEPATEGEKSLTSQLIHGGYIIQPYNPDSEKLKMEFLLANFGILFPLPYTPLDLVVPSPVDACEKITNDVTNKVTTNYLNSSLLYFYII